MQGSDQGNTETLLTKPDAAIIDGNRIGVFVGSSYRMLTIDQAEALRDRLTVLLAAARAQS